MIQKLPKTKVGIINGKLKITEVYYNKKTAKINKKTAGWNKVPDLECTPSCRGILPDGGNEICIGGECIVIPVG